MLDRIIAYHCAPALAGIKPANIFSCLRKDYPDAEFEIERLNKQLNKTGIYFDVLCSCEKRVMVMMYRKNRLEEYITSDSIKKLLTDFGYPENTDIRGYIEYLKKRIGVCMEFPHEIGAFLGYPANDIYGFISKSAECLYTGYWKVYDDVEGSKQRFNRYDRCRRAVMKRINSGFTIVTLFGRNVISAHNIANTRQM